MRGTEANRFCFLQTLWPTAKVKVTEAVKIYAANSAYKHSKRKWLWLKSLHAMFNTIVFARQDGQLARSNWLQRPACYSYASKILLLLIVTLEIMIRTLTITYTYKYKDHWDKKKKKRSKVSKLVFFVSFSVKDYALYQFTRCILKQITNNILCHCGSTSSRQFTTQFSCACWTSSILSSSKSNTNTVSSFTLVKWRQNHPLRW